MTYAEGSAAKIQKPSSRHGIHHNNLVTSLKSRNQVALETIYGSFLATLKLICGATVYF